MNKVISEIEHSILGSIILDNNLMIEAIGQGVAADMFISGYNRELWSIFKKLHHKKMSIDINTIMQENKGESGKIGGVSYISEVASCVASLAGFKDWLKILIQKYQERKIKELGQYISKETGKDPDEIISAIQQQTLDILKIGANDLQDKETRYMNHIDNKYKIKFGEVESAYKSGFIHLDERIGGFKKGNYITIVSGSGVGKTTFSINMALRMAKQGIKTAYYTVEMTEGEMLDKIAASELELDFKKISASNLDDHEIPMC